MPEGITPESLLNNLAETIADGVSKKKSVSFFQEDESKSVGAQFNRLFGRQNPIYNVLGGGKCRMFFLLMCFIIIIFFGRSLPWFLSLNLILTLNMQLLMCCYGGTRRFLQVS